MYIPLLSSTLPIPAGGKYAVGYTTLRFPAAQPYSAPVPLTRAGMPALTLSESVVALYYPTITPASSSWMPFSSSSAAVHWLPDDRGAVLAGYDKFLQGRFGRFGWWIVSKLLGRVQMPVVPRAPLAPPPSDTPYPLVLFSHGLAGTRNTYSQFCSALASEGYVVVAVEHADGSGPAVVRGGRPQTFLKFADTVWPGRTNSAPLAPYAATLDDTHVQMMDLRAAQLDLRVREVYDAYTCFTSLLSESKAAKAADGTVVTVDGERDAARAAAFVDQFRGRVDTSNLQLTGHSFGGATLLRLLTTAAPAGYAPLPAKHCVMLDAWTEPFATTTPLPESTTPPPPTLVINSQAWTETGMFPTQFRLCRAVGASFVTILGLAHQGFSDFALLTSYAAARGYLRTTHRLAMAALTDSLDELDVMRAAADGGSPQRTPGGKLVGTKGDVLVQAKWK